MKLIELSANSPSFKKISFNPEGLTLILGDGAKDKRKGSSNGVGKTLALGLIHHCLGANVSPILKGAIPDWKFCLRFRLDNQEHIVERSADSKHLSLDDNSMNLNTYRKWLDECGVFHLDPTLPYLSFRSLCSRFARHLQEDCLDPIKTNKEPDVEAQLRTLYLLGIDVTLIFSKRQNKKRIDDLKKTLKNWEEDPILHEVFRTHTQPELQIEWLDKEIPRLQEDLTRFEVAENYYAIELEAQEKTHQLRELEKQIAIRSFQMEGIDKCLRQQPDIANTDLLNLYQGLQSIFKPEILTHFEAVEQFHRELIANRKKRLETDKQRLVNEMEQLEQERQHVGKLRDELMRSLQGKRALDEYTALSNHVAKLEAERSKLLEYLEFTKRLQQEIQSFKETMLKEDKRATDYVQKNPLAQFHSRFQKIANTLYPHTPAGIILENNIGDNQMRYKFSVQIQGDDSDGINASRILCFDWLLLMHGANHTMDFLWHDSRLFADMGPKPRAAWFGQMFETLTGSGKQYIATLNIENYESMQEHLDYGQKIALEQAVKLTLRDDKPEHKLLGIQFGSSERQSRLF